MQPMSEFREQLFQNAGADPTRIITFSCAHVIPPENILPIVLCNGPSGKQLDFSFQNRNSLVVVSVSSIMKAFSVFLNKFIYLVKIV